MLILFLIGLLKKLKEIDLFFMIIMIIFFNFIYILFFNAVPLYVAGFGFSLFVVVSITICSGWLAVYNFLRGYFKEANVMMHVFGALIILAFFSGFISNYNTNNRIYNDYAYRFIKNLLLTPSKNSVVFLDGDNKTFLSLYMSKVEGIRDDLQLYSFTQSACREINHFHGFIYTNTNGSFYPGEIDMKFKDDDVYYTSNPLNLKHTTLKLIPCGILHLTSRLSQEMRFIDKIWFCYDEENFLSKSIYRDIFTRELTSQHFLRKSGYEYYTGNITDTTVYLDEASSEGKDIFFILYELALQYIKMNLKDMAQVMLEKSIVIKPNFIEAYICLNNVFRYEGDYKKALETLQNAYEIDPENSLVLCELGSTLNELSEYQKGLDFIKRAITNNPEDPIIYYHMGNSYLGIEKYTDAIKSYNLAISMGAKSPEIFNNLGNALKATGDYYGAASKYENALQFDSDYPPALNNLGLVYTKLKKYDKAIELYKKALEYDPKLSGIYCNLGALYYYQLKNTKEAVIYWEKYIELAPQTKQAGIISSELIKIKTGIK